MDAIVLAGGRGTRMGKLTDDRPKPMLPVAGAPLVVHILHRLCAAGVRRIALATGYQSQAFDAIARFLPGDVELINSPEPTPLGTGGGIALAMEALGCFGAEPVIVVNGDLLSAHSLHQQARVFRDTSCDLVLHVREVEDVRPYGEVECDPFGRVVSFREKPSDPRTNLVNAGTYVLRPTAFGHVSSCATSSFERDIIPSLVSGQRVMAYREDTYFLDVGDPDALVRVEQDAASGLLPDGLLLPPDHGERAGDVR